MNFRRHAFIPLLFCGLISCSGLQRLVIGQDTPNSVGNTVVNNLSVPNGGLAADNPFSHPSSLPFHAPNFEAIQLEHYQPAMMEGMKQQLAEIDAIIALEEPPTFDNTVVPLERSGALLNRTRRVFSNMSSAHTNEHLQQIQTEMAPLLSAHSDSILLNGRLFDRFRTLYESNDSLSLTGEQKEVLRQHYEDFVRAGARLSTEQQNRIRSLNEQLSMLQTKFEDNLLAVTKERSVVVTDVTELDGMSEGDIAAAADRARDRGHDGQYLLEITNTTRVPILTSLNNRTLRQRVWEASANRAIGEDGGIDNRSLILEIAQLRAERAQLLGFNNHAEWKIQNQMAKTPDAARRMLTDLVPAVVARVKEEAQELHKMMAEQGAAHDLEPWDWEYYAEKVRQKKFDVDEAEVKPYFDFDSVLQNGVFSTMSNLFGIEYQERSDLPVYHPDVRVYDVIDADGEQIGLFYVDVFKRDSKRGGAWMSSWVTQSHLLNNNL